MKTLLMRAGMLLALLPLPDAWGGTKNLSKNDGSSCCADIAGSGKNVFIVWEDNELGNLLLDIFYVRSTDGGKTFEPKVNFSNLTSDSVDAHVAVEGDNVYVLWSDFAFGLGDIVMRRSIDGGATFLPPPGDPASPGSSPPTNISNNPTPSVFPRFLVDGNTLHVVWQDAVGAKSEVFYTRSVDGGETFEMTQNLSNNAGNSYRPRIALAGSNVVVAWLDDTSGFQSAVVRRSTDGGASFGSVQAMSDGMALADNLALAAEGDLVAVAWEDFSVDLGEIFLRVSTDGGDTFAPVANVSETEGGVSQTPDIAVVGDAVIVAWEDDVFGDTDILVRRSADQGATFANAKNLSSKQGGNSVDPRFFIRGEKVVVGFKDDTPGHLDTLIAISGNGGKSFGKARNLTKKVKASAERPTVLLTKKKALIVYERDIQGTANRDVFLTSK